MHQESQSGWAERVVWKEACGKVRAAEPFFKRWREVPSLLDHRHGIVLSQQKILGEGELHCDDRIRNVIAKPLFFCILFEREAIKQIVFAYFFVGGQMAARKPLVFVYVWNGRL